EIRPPLAAAHGQRGQRVLEYLLKGQELQNAKVDRGMESQPAFIRTYGAIHFDAEAAIDLNLSAIVKPGHAEHDDAFGLGDALQDLHRPVFRMLWKNQPQRIEYFLDGLMELRFRQVLRFHDAHYVFNVVA